MIFSFLYPVESEAGYDDMHYDLTYYLARSVGYTPEQAFRIASANVSIDYDPDTEPVQQTAQLAMWAAAGASYHLDPSGRGWKTDRKVFVGPPSIPRIKFHAMMDCLNWPKCHYDPVHRANAIAVIPVFKEKLWQDSLENGNFGAYLHSLEDTPTHEGYPSDNGHWSAVDMWWYDDLLMMGAATDYIDYDGNDGKRDVRGLIRDILVRMSTYMKQKIPKQRLIPPEFKSSEGRIKLDPRIENAFRRLKNANPINQAPGFQEAFLRGKQKTKNVNTASMMPAEAIMARIIAMGYNPYDVWKTNAEPKREPAYKAIVRALKDDLKSLEGVYPYEHFLYALDENGAPIGQEMKDKWVLYGNLHLRFMFLKDGKLDVPYKSMEVKIKSVPTFKNEQPYIFDEFDTRGSNVDWSFENLPVGLINIEIYSLGKLVKDIVYDLSKENNNVTIKIDYDNEKAQHELDNHLERLRFLLRQIKQNKSVYEEVTLETKPLIAGLNNAIEKIRNITSRDGGEKDIRKQARDLMDQSRLERRWKKKIRGSFLSMRKTREENQMERSKICSAENISPVMMADHKASLSQRERILTDLELALLETQKVLGAYEVFFNQLNVFKKSMPENFLGLIQQLFKEAEKNQEKMADLISEFEDAQREINDIYEVASRLIDQTLDNIKDRDGKPTSATTDFYEELRTPFIEIYRAAQKIQIEKQYSVDFSRVLKGFIEENDRITIMFEEYEGFYSDLNMDDVNADDFPTAEKYIEKTFDHLQKARMLLQEARSCLLNQENRDSSSQGDVEIIEPLVGYLVVEIEGRGWTPAYGGHTSMSEGRNQKLLTVKNGESPREVVRKFQEKLAKGATCAHWNNWAGGPVGAPMFWRNGPRVTVLYMGPFTRRDSPGRLKLAYDWKALPDVKTPAWPDLRRKACGS